MSVERAPENKKGKSRVGPALESPNSKYFLAHVSEGAEIEEHALVLGIQPSNSWLQLSYTRGARIPCRFDFVLLLNKRR